MATIGEAYDVADALDIASLIEPSPPQLPGKMGGSPRVRQGAVSIQDRQA